LGVRQDGGKNGVRGEWGWGGALCVQNESSVSFQDRRRVNLFDDFDRGFFPFERVQKVLVVHGGVARGFGDSLSEITHHLAPFVPHLIFQLNLCACERAVVRVLGADALGLLPAIPRGLRLATICVYGREKCVCMRGLS